jgi:hypothetical protein
MKRSRILIALALVLSTSAIQINQANAWDPNSDNSSSGAKQFNIQAYYQIGKGAVSGSAPDGAFKTMGIACTSGYLEVGFFDVSAEPKLLKIGNPKNMSVKFDSDTKWTNFAVNTKKGADYVQINSPKSLINKMKTATIIFVSIPSGASNYQAVFTVEGLSKYSSKFAGAGCKI